MAKKDKKTPLILWPFVALWRLLAAIIELTGRLIAIILGIVFMIIGVLLSTTIIGAIIGVPLLIFGILLIVRGFF